jgi:hypothetical protein
VSDEEPVSTSAAIVAAPSSGDRHAAVARAVTGLAVDKALGEGVSPEMKKALAKELAPWAERLAWLLDDWIRIPGTNIRFGLDALVGLVPGVGDVVTGTGSVALLLYALRERIPTPALARMVANIGVDVLGGALPVVGDAFDVAWRSNRKNLEIIKRYQDDPKAEPSPADKALVAVGITLAILSVAIPFAIGAFFGVGIWSLLFGS